MNNIDIGRIIEAEMDRTMMLREFGDDEHRPPSPLRMRKPLQWSRRAYRNRIALQGDGIARLAERRALFILGKEASLMGYPTLGEE